MEYVKFRYARHTAEGSVDAKVGIDDYIKVPKSKGFKGMVVTDHDFHMVDMMRIFHMVRNMMISWY